VIRYELVDMFTDVPFAGSPLGVIPDAGSLNTQAMQAIAAELNTTETVFVLPPLSPRADYRVRVFSPIAETPFGGHSSVGTAATLVRLGLIPAGPVTQECGQALQPLVANATHATMVGRTAVVEKSLDTTILLDITGQSTADLADMRPSAVGFGAPFAFLPVRPAALAGLCVNHGKLADAGLPALCVFCWQPASRTAMARVFAPGFGIPEDPACAPIGMALGAWLVGAGLLATANGSHDYTIHQGAETGRPAILTGTVTVHDGRVTEGTVTGQVTPVASGRIATPISLPVPNKE
jgi:trans-2,3-dihydro-3-hydroxyanthranilate isomerase